MSPRASALPTVVVSLAAFALVPALVVACKGDGKDDTMHSPAPQSSTQTRGMRTSNNQEKVGEVIDGGPNDAYALPMAVPSSDAASTAGPLPQIDSYTTHDGALTVTPIHHASLLLQFGGKNIYLDPISEDTSYAGMPKADYIFLTHTHADHLDPKGMDAVKKPGTVLVGPPSVNAKIPMTVTLANGAKKDFGLFSVVTVPMYNLKNGPAPGKLYHPKGEGQGYVFTFGYGQNDGGTRKSGLDVDGGPFIANVYVSGDTECTPEMRALKDIDIAFVSMNLPYTMTPEEAAQCVDAFHPRIVYPYHYRGSNLDAFSGAVKPTNGIEVKIRDWYAK